MDEVKTIRVVAAIIIENEKVFATQRGYGDFKDGWEFPGGKIDAGETDCFICSIKSGDLVLKEHEAAQWLKKETLDSVDWLPADLGLIDKIREYL